MALKGNTVEEKIWNFFMEKLSNTYGVAGLMGNLFAESGLNPKNLENLCERRLKESGKPYCTDDTYTEAVDSGKISRNEFLHPLPGKQYGYGLAQWTSAGRKSRLYDFIKAKGVSIGDLETQLEFLYKELCEKYKTVLNTLKTASSIRAASDIVLAEFECPADQGVALKEERARYGQSYINKYGQKKVNETKGGGTMLSNCGHDEKNKYKGGKAGDQTGSEWALIKWYNRPWKCVLRHPDAKVRKKISQLAKEAAENNLIGYDQGQRYTFWEHLKTSDYLPSKITVSCEADCSSGVAAIVKAVGYLLKIQKLKDVSVYLYTGNMRAGLKAAGFEVLTNNKYLTSDKYLMDGDILLNDSCHVATNIGNGSGINPNSKKADASCPYKEPSSLLKKGCVGTGVSWLQWHLNTLLAKGVIKATYNGKTISKLVVDGDWGSKTEAVFKAFQKKYPETGTNNKPDGKCGSASRKKLKSLIS